MEFGREGSPFLWKIIIVAQCLLATKYEHLFIKGGGIT
jgi:hypothetical protein